MKNMNRQILLGTVGKEVEIKALDHERKVASFTMVTNEYWKDQSGEFQENTEWHNIVVWRPSLVDYVAKNLQKGSLVYVEGMTKTNAWEKEGIKHYRKEVHASFVTSTERSKQVAASDEDSAEEMI